MARYFGSPWGFLRGKMGHAVGGYWKGIEWARAHVFPKQKGTVELYHKFKAGLITEKEFSFKQMNMRRMIIQTLGDIGTQNLGTFIYPVWEKLARQQRQPLTGINMFVQENASRLWNSIPEQNKEYHPETNCPDMSKMIIADGRLEPAPFTDFNYDPDTGDCTFKWGTFTEKSGSPDDFVYPMVFTNPILNKDWTPAGKLYGRADVTPISRRKDGSTIFTIPKEGLEATDVLGYIFCRDDRGEVGFSVSDCREGK